MILVQFLLFCQVSLGSKPRPGFERQFEANNDKETAIDKEKMLQRVLKKNGLMTALKTCP